MINPLNPSVPSVPSVSNNIIHIIDLSHPLREDMPVYPGTPPLKIRQAADLHSHGFREKALDIVSHMGTHLDAPAHILPNGPTLDALPMETFFGPAVVVDARSYAASGQIPLEAVAGAESQIKSSRFTLFFTGWSQYWDQERYFAGYPILSPEAARRLAQLQPAGVGVDAISFDASDDSELPIHHTLLSQNIILIENLANLEKLINRSFFLACFPLPIHSADGSPVRAAAVVFG